MRARTAPARQIRALFAGLGLVMLGALGMPVPFCRLVERLLAHLKKLDPRLDSWTPARVS